MATTHGNIFLDNFDVLASAAVAAFTVGTDLVKVTIAAATIHNYGTTKEDFTIYIVPPGGSVNDLSEAISTRSIAVDETIDLFELIGRPMLQGGAIHAKASNITKLSLSVSGSEESS